MRYISDHAQEIERVYFDDVTGGSGGVQRAADDVMRGWCAEFCVKD